MSSQNRACIVDFTSTKEPSYFNVLIERTLAKIVEAALKSHAQGFQGRRAKVIRVEEITVLGFLKERVMKRAVRLPIRVPILDRHRAPHADDRFIKPYPKARPIALVCHTHGLV